VLFAQGGTIGVLDVIVKSGSVNCVRAGSLRLSD
jgi:hypothetical protein